MGPPKRFQQLRFPVAPTRVWFGSSLMALQAPVRRNGLGGCSPDDPGLATHVLVKISSLFPSGVWRWAPYCALLRLLNTVPLSHLGVDFRGPDSHPATAAGVPLSCIRRRGSEVHCALTRASLELCELPSVFFTLRATSEDLCDRSRSVPRFRMGFHPHTTGHAEPELLLAPESVPPTSPYESIRRPSRSVPLAGFRTRNLSFLPPGVEALFQTGNTPGIAPTPTGRHLKTAALPNPEGLDPLTILVTSAARLLLFDESNCRGGWAGRRCHNLA